MIKRFLYRILCGFFLGISAFAPGFSGNIVAIIMGVYHEIIRIAANPFKDFKKNVIYCIPLGIGVAISAVVFVFGFSFLLGDYEKATYFLFVGLICGNIPEIIAEIKKTPFKIQNAFAGAIAFAITLALGIMAVNTTGSNAVTEITASVLRLGIGGILGGFVMFIPGMSVSAILVLAGVYEDIIYIAHGIMRFDFTYLLHFCVFCVSVVVGIILTSNGIKYVFKKFPGVANTAVFGFMIGSLLSVLIKAFMLPRGNSSWWLSTILLIVGLVISFLFVILAKYLKKTTEDIDEEIEQLIEK